MIKAEPGAPRSTCYGAGQQEASMAGAVDNTSNPVTVFGRRHGRGPCWEPCWRRTASTHPEMHRGRDEGGRIQGLV